jgi:hypothetical protein
MSDSVAIKQAIEDVINNRTKVGLRSEAHYFEFKKLL